MTYDALPHGGRSAQRSLTIGDWFRLLVADRWILASWLVLVTFSFAYGYFLLSIANDAGSPLPASQVLMASLIAGYWAWSMYWGVPGCIWLLWRSWRRVFFGFSMWGFAILGVYLTAAFLLLIFYPPLGGGVFHFFRRWWKSGKRMQNPDVPPVPQPSYAMGAVMPVPSAVASIAAPKDQLPFVVAPPAVRSAAVSSAPPAVNIVSAPEPSRSAEPISELEQRLRALAQLHERGAISRDEHDRQRIAILDKI